MHAISRSQLLPCAVSSHCDPPPCHSLRRLPWLHPHRVPALPQACFSCMSTLHVTFTIPANRVYLTSPQFFFIFYLSCIECIHVSWCTTVRNKSIIITRCKYFDPCYARATVVRARFLAAEFSDGSYLAHVNGAYLRHVTFCIVRGPPLFIASPRLSLSVGPLAYAARCPLTVPGWSKVHDGDFEGVEQTCSRIQPASPILV